MRQFTKTINWISEQSLLYHVQFYRQKISDTRKQNCGNWQYCSYQKLCAVWIRKKNLKKKPLKEQVKKQSYKLSYNQVKNNISWTKKRNKIKKTNFKQRKYILNKWVPENKVLKN